MGGRIGGAVGYAGRMRATALTVTGSGRRVRTSHGVRRERRVRTVSQLRTSRLKTSSRHAPPPNRQASNARSVRFVAVRREARLLSPCSSICPPLRLSRKHPKIGRASCRERVCQYV